MPLLNVGGRGGAQFPMTLLIERHWRVDHETNTAADPPITTDVAVDSEWATLPGYAGGFLEMRVASTPTQVCGIGYQVGTETLTRFTFTAPDGTEYELRDTATGGRPASNGSCSYLDNYRFRGTEFVSADSSGLTFISDSAITDSPYGNPSPANGYILTRDGVRYRIDNGWVSWIRDRNGNKITFSYNSYNEVIGVTDSLNRSVTIEYNVSDAQYGFGDRITYQGFGGANRTLYIAKRNLSDPGVLRTTQLGDSSTTKTYYDLFGDLNGSSSSTPYNPVVYSAVWLPNGTSYQFRYNIYGELARIDLPTSGAIEYDYGAGEANYGTEGVYLDEIYRRVFQRRTYKGSSLGTLEGTTTYSRAAADPSSSQDSYVEVAHLDASGNTISKDDHFFYGFARDSLFPPSGIAGYYAPWKAGREHETQLLDASSNVLRQVDIVWAQRALVSWWQSWMGTSDKAPSNDPRVSSKTTKLLDNGNNLVAQQTYGYDDSVPYNNLSDTYEYDFGNGSPGALKRHIHTSYKTDTAYVSSTSGAHIRNLPISAYVQDGAGNTVAQSMMAYDEYGLQTYPSVTGWNDPGTTARGNLTSASSWVNTSNSWLTSHVYYDQVGNPIQHTDARGINSYLGYTDNFSDGIGRNTYAFPTSTTSAVPDPNGGYGSNTALTSSSSYDYSTGKVTSTTDPNGQTTTVQYNDSLDRLKSISYPDGGSKTYTYVDVHQCGPYIETRTLIDTRWTDDYVFYDGLGRSVRTFKYEGQDANNPYLTADTQYDALGRAYRTSNPYRSSGCSAAVNPSGNWTTTAYDALGRVTSVTTPDGAQVITTFSGNQVTVTDQAGKKRSSVTDALGRLTNVTEDPNGLAYQTTYGYDTLGNLSTVTQGTQHRYFMYDSLSRLIRARNPELDANANLALSDPISGNSQWSIAYAYDADGNLSSRTDARGVTATYTYDNLNRNTIINYSDGSYTNHVYDFATNGRGRLRYSASYPTTGAYSVTVTDTYDAMGRPTYERQHFWINGNWSTPYVTQRIYNYAGAVTLQTYPSGRVVNYSYDQAARTSGFTGNLGDGTTRTYAGSISYDEWSGIYKEQFGTDTPLYHKEHRNVRGQLYDIRLSTVNDDLNWNRGAIVNYYSFQPYGFGTSGPDNNGNLLVQQAYVPADDSISSYSFMQENYAYDALNRITWAGEFQNGATHTGAQGYSYDQYGNRTLSGWFGTGIPGQSFSVDTNTNRLGVPSGSYGSMQYDANGNLTYDTYSGNGTRNYDAENRMVSATNNGGQTSIYTYDADGHRVRRNSFNSETWQVYGMDGELEAEYAANTSTSSPQKEYGYRNGQLLVSASGSSCGVGYQGTKSWGATSGALGHVVGHQEGSDWVGTAGTDSAGFMSYGPYDNTFGQGHHTAKFLLQVNSTAGSDVVATLDVVTNFGGTVLAQRQIKRNEFSAANQWQWFTLEFDNPCFGLVEARINWAGAVSLRFNQLTITGVSSTGSAVEWMVTDQLGTPRMIADKTGSLAGVSRHDYLPFGEELYAGSGGRTAGQGYQGNDGIRQQFTQKERDSETGLDYFQARYYSSNQGRFTSVDPGNYQATLDPTNPQSWNAYAYVNNNPLRYTDPDGKGIKDFFTKLKNWIVYSVWGDEEDVQKEEQKRRQDLLAQANPDGNVIMMNVSGQWIRFNPNELTRIQVWAWSSLLYYYQETGGGKHDLTPQELSGVINSANLIGTAINTTSQSRSAAFQEAKKANDIPTSSEPDKVIKPGTPEGDAAGLRPNENTRMYEFTNSRGEKIWIREDAPAQYPDGGSQGPHFNSGPAGQKLVNHHYWTP